MQMRARPFRPDGIPASCRLAWVPGYEGLYAVTDRGDVVSYKWGKVRALKHTAHGQGYRMVQLRRNGKRKSRTVHSLVLEAFVGPRPDGAVARHLNDQSDDNRLENLAWGTQAQNYADAVRNGSHTPDSPRHAKLSRRQVLAIKKRLAEGEDCAAIARDHDVTRGQISHIKHGRSWAHIA